MSRGRAHRARAAALLGVAAALACRGPAGSSADSRTSAQSRPEVPPTDSGSSPAVAGLEPDAAGGLPLAELSLDAWPLEERTAARAPDSGSPGHLVDHRSDRLVSAPLPGDVRWLGFGALEAPGYRPRAVLEPAEERNSDAGLPIAALEARSQRVAVDGFAVPAAVGAGFDAERFYLWPWPNGCCAGREPRLDELVVVQLAPGSREVVDPLQPIRAVGIFDAGERLDVYGFAESLYRIEGARLVR